MSILFVCLILVLLESLVMVHRTGIFSLLQTYSIINIAQNGTYLERCSLQYYSVSLNVWQWLQYPRYDFFLCFLPSFRSPWWNRSSLQIRCSSDPDPLDCQKSDSFFLRRKIRCSSFQKCHCDFWKSNCSFLSTSCYSYFWASCCLDSSASPKSCCCRIYCECQPKFPLLWNRAPNCCFWTWLGFYCSTNVSHFSCFS